MTDELEAAAARRLANTEPDDGDVILGCMYGLLFSAPVWVFLGILALLWWLR